jgi:hypothetical protein
MRRLPPNIHVTPANKTSAALLKDRQGVLARVDDEGHPRESEVGDAMLGLEPRHVVFLDADAVRAELVKLCL